MRRLRVSRLEEGTWCVPSIFEKLAFQLYEKNMAHQTLLCSMFISMSFSVLLQVSAFTQTEKHRSRGCHKYISPAKPFETVPVIKGYTK